MFPYTSQLTSNYFNCQKFYLMQNIVKLYFYHIIELNIHLNMDPSLEITNVKNEQTNLTSNDHLKKPSEIQVGSVKQEDDYLIHSKLDIKTENQKDESKFSVITGTSFQMWSYDDIKIETEEPLFKIKCDDLLDELIQDPLEVDSEIKEVNLIQLEHNYCKLLLENFQLTDCDRLFDVNILKSVEEHFPIDLSQSELVIKTDLTEEKKIDNLLESDEESDSDKSESNESQYQLLIRNDTDQSKTKKYVCHFCNKTFKFKSVLDEHLHIHTGEKPYTCDVCTKSFSQKGTLYRHMFIHSGKKPYVCDVCKNVFSRKGSLDSHKLVHSSIKQFSCDMCGKSFARKQGLLAHKRIHTGNKPFACDMCKNVFTQKAHLTSHRRLHTGEKPYSCDVCNKPFAHESALTRHKNLHKNQ